MSKSPVKTKKPVKRPKLARLMSNQWKEPPLKIYGVGIYFPERDPLDFEVIAHEFDIIKENVYFYARGEFGIREFVASFTHVAYIVVKDKPTEAKKIPLPKDFGKISKSHLLGVESPCVF